ncbi:Phosphopantetheine adenylyltransferase [Saccharicrinis carchari]|uniref:Phosphopantetheine adenylyltransferase n=1 Tax=Saccharicrinis carchari TaxID=1168039 RepID=A0A521BXW3_SACCC|nr:pantetheine-phosphate adenylyltransferase [Saccharicrinis carchari]SMO51310.1 Phosphopantetheine adenylyltransferase [Saccharicrinis carchari]
MKRIAIFPGSFDPFTIGHHNIVQRAVYLFDELVIGIGFNAKKQDFYPVDKRIEWISYLFEDQPKIRVEKFEGLTVDFAKSQGAGFILRGIRTSADFEYERAIAQVNKAMSGVESVFLLTTPEHTPVNSTIVRDIIRHKGDAGLFIPEKIREKVKEYRR